MSSVDGETSRIMALLSSPACLQMHSNSSSVGHAWMWSDFKPWNFKPTRVRELWERETIEEDTVKRAKYKKKKKKKKLTTVEPRKKHSSSEPEKGWCNGISSYPWFWQKLSFPTCKLTVRPNPIEPTCPRGHSGWHLWQGIMGVSCASCLQLGAMT